MKIVIVLAMFLFGSACVKAQSSSETKPAQKNINEIKNKPNRGFKASSSSRPGKYTKSNIKAEVSLLQELDEIIEKRNQIEDNVLIPTTQRTQELENINSSYVLKKREFMTHVETIGVVNSSKKEQSYYLSFLKDDNRGNEYKTVIESIKNHK